MTVKELIETLQSCNQDADVYVTTDAGSHELKDEDIFQYAHNYDVVIDISVASLSYKKEAK